MNGEDSVRHHFQNMPTQIFYNYDLILDLQLFAQNYYLAEANRCLLFIYFFKSILHLLCKKERMIYNL